MDEKNKILIRTFHGVVNMDGIIEAWQEDIQSNIVNKELHAIITDFSEANNIAKLKDLDEISSFYDKHYPLFKDIKLAVVLNSPNVAIIVFYEEKYPQLNHRAFATLQAALNWILTQ